ncbi:MAG TPA: LLM class flavin-dependent oxidoreductase [bacterium]|nr:LLM class flavin-dependent oxidoreductase [bacterium]
MIHASGRPTARRTRFAISLPQFVGDGAFDPARFRAHVARAEALGFDSAWTQEQVLGSMPHLGPIETMTYAAACTERLRLGCAVFVLPLHSPVHLAKSLSTLDQLSRGRLEIGVGIGGRRMFSAFAVDPDRLVTRFVEGLQLMKALWTEPRVTFKGRFWQLDGATMEPKPFQKPYPPIWFGAAHPNAVRRAVRHGDGFFGAGSQTTARFAEQVRILRDALEERGRSAGGFRIAKRVYIAVDDDARRARQRGMAVLQALYRRAVPRDLEAVAVFGPPRACVDGLREVVEAGAEMILLTPPFDEAAQMERLAAEVIPRVLE